MLRVDPHTVAFLQAAGCVYADDEARILTESASSADELRTLLDRRAAGEPLEYIVGWADFCGLRVPVCTGVFVPRRRSEFLAECAVGLVRVAAGRAADDQRRVKLLDLCCGSGAIGLAVAIQTGCVELLATDDSPAAVECARANLERVDGRVFRGDLFDAIPRAERHSFDLIVANAPYVPTNEIRRLPIEARLHEPTSTLDGGPDGTSVQRRIFDSAPGWLRATGLLLMETSSEISDVTARLARDAGFDVDFRECPEIDATVVVASRRP